MAGPRVLTFNFHEPYLWLMAKTGFDFTIGSYDDPALAREWHTHYRPIPSNMTIVGESAWRAGLDNGQFDVVVAQNESNAATLHRYEVPALLVCHNRRTFLSTTVTGENREDVDAYARLLERLQERFKFIFISESKRDDYGIPGDVILPGIDVEEFGGYTGEEARILRVGNMMRDRNLMFDVDFQERVCQGLPNRIAGVDPAMPDAQEARSFEDLLHLYRTHRCLLHVTREEYEDGYNLSTLEAMACGMPVVSLANRTSPLTDGLDGVVSAHAEVLRGRLVELLDNPELARILGARGRETVARKFPIGAFVENWRRVIETAAESGQRKTRRTLKPKSLRIAMQYIANPITTARYLEQAARRHHEVVTVGFRSPEEVLELWGFRPPYPDYPAQDVDLPLYASCKEWAERLPGGFTPDLFLWVDSGASRPPDGLDTLSISKVCYLIDTHVSAELRLAMAQPFDFAFMAQKAHLDAFKSAGVEDVFWLPLACCPELHDVPGTARTRDVAFVGSTQGDPSGRRARILEEVAGRFPNNHIGMAWPDEMARIYAQSKIVVNTCVARDLNMRVFEALASGALLITDEADGLEDLFEDGVQLVVYRRDEDLPGLIQRYLEDDGARERIAAAGKSLVLERHTYAHRIDEMLAQIPRRTGGGGVTGESWFSAGGYYRKSRPDLARFVPPSVRRVLDVGCGCGDFGRLLKSHGVKEVHGIESVERACEIAQGALDGAVLGSIEEMELPYEDGYFDCITFGDVLEHLVDPAAALRKVTRVLADDGFILMSIPNVRFYAIVGMLGNGRWQYVDAGIMDRTHLRFFTAHEMRELVEDAGLEVLEIDALSYLKPGRIDSHGVHHHYPQRRSRLPRPDHLSIPCCRRQARHRPSRQGPRRPRNPSQRGRLHAGRGCLRRR
ncbi:MAG: glycosyltransferase [Nitrospiraceae bacterium]|nr:glycosyltransferase [Nitrospiraceae bacterium]